MGASSCVIVSFVQQQILVKYEDTRCCCQAPVKQSARAEDAEFVTDINDKATSVFGPANEAALVSQNTGTVSSSLSLTSQCVLNEGGPPQSPPTSLLPPEAQEVVTVPAGTHVQPLEPVRLALQSGDAMLAEHLLIEALDGAMNSSQEEAQELLHTEEFASVLQLMRVYETALRDVVHTEGPGWIEGPEMNVDPSQFGLALDAATERSLREFGVHPRLYHRRYSPDGGATTLRDIQFSLPLPTYIDQSPSLLGVVAMLAETDLMHLWHPIASKGCQHRLQPREPYHNLELLTFSFPGMKVAQIVESRLFADHEAGVLLLNNRIVAPDHEYWDLPAAKTRNRRFPAEQDVFILGVPGEHITVYSFLFRSRFTKSSTQPPEWIYRWVLNWLFPEMTRQAYKAGAALGSPGSPHAECMERDDLGLYAHLRRVVSRGVALERESGRARHPSPEDIVQFRARRIDMCSGPNS